MKKFWKFEIISAVCFVVHWAAFTVPIDLGILSYIMYWSSLSAIVVCTVIAIWSLDKTIFKRIILIVLQLLGYCVLWVIALFVVFFVKGGITL